MTRAGRADSPTRRMVRHARAQMAVKAAVAAVLAWFAAGLFTPDIAAYRYYAPLGAVVATYPTIATSVRSSAHAVLAIVIGGALGLTLHLALTPGVVAVALAVGVGVALAGLPFLGEQRSYVPVVALLVLVIGGADARSYALAYATLTLLGAGIGVLVNLTMPALRLTQGQDAVRSLETLLADQLDDLADGLRQTTPPGREEWRQRMRPLTPGLDRMREGVREAEEAQRGNPRARLYGYEANRQRDAAHALERVVVLVEDLAEILLDTHREDLPRTSLDRELAETAATALERLADLVRCYHAPLSPTDPRVEAGFEAMSTLTEAFAGRRYLDPADVAMLGTIVGNLRRCLETMVPREARRG